MFIGLQTHNLCFFIKLQYQNQHKIIDHSNEIQEYEEDLLTTTCQLLTWHSQVTRHDHGDKKYPIFEHPKKYGSL